MSKFLKLLVTLGIIAVVSFAGLATTIVSVNNDSIQKEAGIKDQYRQNQENYNAQALSLFEILSSHMPETKKEDVIAIYDNIAHGRPGDKKLMNSVLANQIKLMTANSALEIKADYLALKLKKEEYLTGLGQPPNKLISKILGFPRINLDEYDTIQTVVEEPANESTK